MISFSKDNLNNATLSQIHSLNLLQIKGYNPELFQEIINNYYYYLSFPQWILLTRPNLLNDINQKNLPSNFMILLDLINQIEYYNKIHPFCVDPDTYILQKNDIQSMPPLLKLVYVCNYAEKITPETMPLFQSTIETIFQNPSLFCPELFLIFIKKWTKETITETLNTMDINKFPKVYLYDLFQRFQLPNKILNNFQINELSEIQDDIKRKFVFEIFLNHYINIKHSYIQNINVNNLNEDEILLLIEKCNKYLSKEQVQQISIGIMNLEILLLFISKHINKITKKQLKEITLENYELAQIVINSIHIDNLSINQVNQIKIEELDNISAQIFFNHTKFYKIFTPDQVKHIKLNLINIDNQEEFIQTNAENLTKDQTESINFELYKTQETTQTIVQKLHEYNKLDYLIDNQVMQIKVHKLSDQNLILQFFSISKFAKFFTNGDHEVINDKTIPLIDFNNVENGFLNYATKNMLNKLGVEQINQINIKNLDHDVREHLIKNKISVLEDKSIQSIDITDLGKDNLNLIVIKKSKILNINQLKKIDINQLNINSQKILLNTRLNDLLSSQIQCFDTSNTEIAKILINNKSSLLSSAQINVLPFHTLEIKEQAIIFDKKNAFYPFIDPCLIKSVNLPELKEYNQSVYRDLILLKLEYLTVRQLMTVDFHSEPFEYALAERYLLKQINADRDLEVFLYDDSKVSKLIIDQMPEEFKVVFLNSIILNNNTNRIPIESRSEFTEAIRTMFKSSDDYLYSVEYILNNWTNESKELIQNIINDLKITKFSKETNDLIFHNYIFDLNDEQIQCFDLSSVSTSNIDSSLLNRACDFNPKQFTSLNYPNADQISQQIPLIKEDIAKLNVGSLTEILMNYIVNKKLDLLCDNQVMQICMKKLNQQCFDSLLSKKLDVLCTKQIEELNLNQLKQDQLNEIIINKYTNLSKDQVLSINLKNLSLTALNKLISHRSKDFQIDKIKNEITISMLNQLDNYVLLRFLKKWISNISIDQLQGIVLECPQSKFMNSKRNVRCKYGFKVSINQVNRSDIAAFLLKERAKDLSEKQIQCLDLSFDSPICQKLRKEKLFINTILRNAHIIKYLTDEQFNEIIEFTNYLNIIEIIKEDQQHRINEKNVHKMISINFDDCLQYQDGLKIINSCIKLYSDDQFHRLSTKNLDVVKIIFCNNLQNRMDPYQVREIDLDELNDKQIKQLILSKSSDFNLIQLATDKITENLPKFDDETLLALLNNCIDKLSNEQIQKIRTENIRIISILLMNRPKDISQEQIHQIEDISMIDEELKKMEYNKTFIEIMRENNLFKNLSDDQFNNEISYDLTENVIEILNENCQDRISEENAQKIKIDEIQKEKQFSKLIDSCIQYFTVEQIMQINLNEGENAKFLKSIFKRIPK